MKRKCRILLWVTVLCVLLLSACERQGRLPDYFAFQTVPFSAELCGELNGVAFCAVIRSKPTDTGHEIALTYLADAKTGKETALTGIEITAVLDTSGVPVEKSVSLTCGELHANPDGQAVRGLLVPITALLVGNDVTAVQRSGACYTVTKKDGGRLTVDEKGVPRSYTATHTLFEVVWWETDVVTE